MTAPSVPAAIDAAIQRAYEQLMQLPPSPETGYVVITELEPIVINHTNTPAPPWKHTYPWTARFTVSLHQQWHLVCIRLEVDPVVMVCDTGWMSGLDPQWWDMLSYSLDRYISAQRPRLLRLLLDERDER
jgi:hypothetical protein